MDDAMTMLRSGFSRFALNFRVATLVAIATLCLIWTVPASAADNYNLLFNPDLTGGTGGTPDYWHSEAFVHSHTGFTWILDQWTGQLEISNAQPNDAGWGYDLHLDPGWYHFTANIRTKNVPDTPNTAGAALCVMEDAPRTLDLRGNPAFGSPPSPCSQQVRGTTDWQPVGIYVKAGGGGVDGMLTCRLGGFSAMNTGEAFWKDISAVQVEGPSPDDGDPILDLDLEDTLTPTQP